MAIEAKGIERDFQPGYGSMMFGDEQSKVILKDYRARGQQGSAQGWSNVKSKSPSTYPHIASTTNPTRDIYFSTKTASTKPRHNVFVQDLPDDRLWRTCGPQTVDPFSTNEGSWYAGEKSAGLTDLNRENTIFCTDNLDVSDRKIRLQKAVNRIRNDSNRKDTRYNNLLSSTRSTVAKTVNEGSPAMLCKNIHVALSKQNRLASLNNTGFTANEKSQDRSPTEPYWNIAKDNPNRITARDKLTSPQYKTFQMKK